MTMRSNGISQDFRNDGGNMKKKLAIVRKQRTRSLFNTGTQSHKSIKDYTRKVKHKENISGDRE